MKDLKHKKLPNNDYDLLYNMLVNGMSFSDYKSELQDRTMPQEKPKQITENDVLSAWILSKDEYALQYSNGGHLHEGWFSDITNGTGFGDFISGLGLSSDQIMDYYGKLGQLAGGNEYFNAANTLINWGGEYYDNVYKRPKEAIDTGMTLNESVADQQNFSIGDNALLKSQLDSRYSPELVNNDYTGIPNGWQTAANISKKTVQGALAGSKFDPLWGSIIGGVLGAGAGVVQDWQTREKGLEALDFLNKDALEKQKQIYSKSENAKYNSDMLNLYNQLSLPYMAACGGSMKHKHDIGGYLNSHYDYITDPLTRVDAGGTHQENPNEGVLTSIAPDGQPNLVEEGETIIDNGSDVYVFSDRIVADQEILKSHLLNEKFAGKTYADISKELDKIINEHKTDDISMKTFNEMIKRLQDALEDQKFQEKQKEVEQFLNSLSDEQKDQLEQRMVEEAQLEAQIQQAMQEQAAQQEAQEQAVQEELIETQIQEQQQAPSYEVMNLDLITDAANQGMFGNGGHMHQDLDSVIQVGNWTSAGLYPPGSTFKDLDLLDKASFEEYYKKLPKDLINDLPLEYQDYGTYYDPNKGKAFNIDDLIGGNSNNSGKALNTLSRYAPVLGSAWQNISDIVGLTNKNDFSNVNMYQKKVDSIPNVGFSPIGGYMTFNPIDETYQQNQLRSMNEATRRAVTNNSNGNASAALASLVALNNQQNNAFGNLGIQAREYNDTERLKIAEHNNNINRINASLSMSAQEKNQAIAAEKARMYQSIAAMRQNIIDANDAAKANNYLNLMTNLGNVGRENFMMNDVNNRVDYLYGRNPDGSFYYKYGLSNAERKEAKELADKLGLTITQRKD